ncbi:NAD-dependent DNA ligase LigA [Mycoplasmopsis cricetuli]|uniref:NAD-dependent DNA ligase LigA n=1 Tax=Mycoplasmopsis cricetuli TaxID=171283 RepID=UPI00056C2CCD|nr:NAD-dependent DNA ligase LigA [Mycoplasmopsis cricetuli]
MNLPDKDQIIIAKKRIAKLVSMINFWNYEYYELDFPSISDQEYDIHYQELLALEKQYPELKKKNSPTNKVGGKPSFKFQKFQHTKTMLSLNKAYSIDDVIKFHNDNIKTINNQNISYSLEPKIDGLSISLHYQNGKLIQAVTRGDGITGEIVTNNIKCITNLPYEINYYNDLEIRGEVYLSKTNYSLANERLKLENKLNDNLKTLKNILDMLININEDIKFLSYQKKIKNTILNYKNNFNLSFEELQKQINETDVLIEQNIFVKTEKIKTKPKIFANPRNAASGTLRQLDLNVVKQRKLSYFVYEIVDPEKHNIFSQIDVLNFLKKLNFKTNEYIFNAPTIEQVINKINSFKNIKQNLSYDCDGFVIKVNEIKHWNQLGFTSKFPKYAIAFKYETEEAITKVIDITAEVGRTGKITYLARLEPVQLNQTTVRAATLHNYEFIKSLNLNIGDSVKLIKSGEIIPKVIELVEKHTQSIFTKILFCPSCNYLLSEKENLVDQFCKNDFCNEKIIRSLIHFASREGMNIIDLGEENIRLFYNNGIIQKISDIYDLEHRKKELNKLPNMAKKRIQKIISSIEKSKKTTLPKTLFAIGIKNVGAQVSELICNRIDRLLDLTKIDLNSLTEIKTIGTSIVESIKNFLSNAENIELLNFLDNTLEYQNTKKGTSLANLSFVITGTLSQSRDYFKKIISENGGKILSNISNQTDYLLVGENAGNKLAKAKNNNIKIIDENQLYMLIKK